MTIMFCNPAICSVLAWVLLGEAFGLLTVLGCLASMAGVALVARPPFLFGEALGKHTASHEAWRGSGGGPILGDLHIPVYSPKP